MKKSYLWGLFVKEYSIGSNECPLHKKVWTKKKPTAPGWYWWRRENCGPVIINLFMFSYINELQIQCVGTATIVPLLAAHESAEWLGPIEPRLF